MSDRVAIAITFISFVLLFTGVGIYSATRKQNTTSDYLLASRNVNPWLTALSAMATGQSGFLFVGQVGFAYTTGISVIWLVLGWAIGDYLAWLFVFGKLREMSEANSSETVSAFLGQSNNRSDRLVVIISALITIAFLGAYAAAQLVAGSKALEVMFGWQDSVGIVIGAILVVIYCFSGGIRASIWTDTVQGIIMIGSLAILFVVALNNCGGFAQLWTKLGNIDPDLVSFSPSSLPWGFIPFLLGWIVAGFGAIGQPHILVRAMAIDSAKNIIKALNIKVLCGSITSCCAIGIGLTGRVLMPELMQPGGDPELALPLLSEELLPIFMVGMMLAGLFSATMSTADSQILSCSAAITQDLFPNYAKSYNIAKLGTLTVTAIVLVIALSGEGNVFNLVTFGWSVLAASLGPLLLVRVLQMPVDTFTAIAMMVTGIITVYIWNYFDTANALYEVLPGMLAGILVYPIAKVLMPFFAARKQIDK